MRERNEKAKLLSHPYYLQERTIFARGRARLRIRVNRLLRALLNRLTHT